MVADVVKDGAGNADITGLCDADGVHPRLAELGVRYDNVLGRGDPNRSLGDNSMRLKSFQQPLTQFDFCYQRVISSHYAY